MKPALAASLLFLALPASAQQIPLATLEGTEPFGRFGEVMALAGDVDADGVQDIIVGAPKADLAGDRRGQAFVFSGADLSLLHTFDGSANLRELGTAVDGAGDVDGDGHDDLIVGEPWPYSTSVVTGPARAYVFSGFDGHVIHVLQGTVVGDDFGAAVAGVGDVNGDGLDDVAVGAPGLIAGNSIHGRVAVFSGADGSLLHEVPLPELDLAFGSALDVVPDRTGDGVPELIIGASRWVGPGSPFAVGAAFAVSGADGALLTLYEGVPYSSSSGPLSMGLTAGALGDVDGDGVADVWGGANTLLRVWSGATGAVIRDHTCSTKTWDRPRASSLGDFNGDGRDDYVVGDPEAVGTALVSGHARIVSGADGSLRGLQRGIHHYGKLGTSVLGLGDSDGDGHPEFLLGRPWHANSSAGEVLLLEHSPLQQLVEVVESDPDFGGFGRDVRAAGDVDADGAVDVIVGEPWDDSAAGDAGRVRVFSGRDGSELHSLLGEFNQDRMGSAVDGVGDLDGDGHADFAAGLPFRLTPHPGAVHVWSGRTGDVLHDLDGLSVTDRFGTSVAGVGDMDGDGVPDVAIGAPFDDTGAAQGGRALVASGADGSTVFELFGGSASLALGQTVAGGGDVNSDGVPDLLVGIPNQLVGPDVPGVVRVVSGASGLALYDLAGEVHGGQFGGTPTSLSIVGDLDGDGLDDVLVGSPYEGAGGSFTNGAVRAFSGLLGAPLWTREGFSGHALGASVAAYVDRNADGHDDVLVGVPGAILDEPRQGEARLLSGLDGSVLGGWPGLTEDAELGWSVDTLGDLDLDGLPEVLLAGDEFGNGFGRFMAWYGGDGSSVWENAGHALPGTAGAPTLQPSGTLVAGSSFTLALGSAAPGSSAWLVLGLSPIAASFKGGVLVPSPDLVIAGLPTDGAGALSITATWPTGLPTDFATWYQYWIVDGAAPVGLAASNAVRSTTP